MGLLKKGLDETIEWGIDVCSTRCMGAGADQNVIMVAYGKIISGLIPQKKRRNCLFPTRMHWNGLILILFDEKFSNKHIPC